tara:strand:+ start:299 stop:1435 length:1137 start_codon:yes stop_codon:yes gene_type:complete
MTTKEKDPVLVVVQLSGGNDYLNTVIPYNDPTYYDNRPTIRYDQDEILPVDKDLAFNPQMGALKDIYDQGDLAVIHGVGWEESTRSHFRAMDIWHTAEPDKVGMEGWLGRAIRQLDPESENPVTAVNVGYGLPRALVAPNASVASVADLEAYGMLSSIEQKQKREDLLKRFANMYAPAIGSSQVMDYIGQTGLDALKGADMLKVAPGNYDSDIEYDSANPLAQKLRDVSRIHLAGLGTRIFYTEHGGFDTHASQASNHPKLWNEVSTAIGDFWQDIKEHNADENVVMFVFSEFGRRVKENGSGTDHGAGGVAMAIGSGINGGMHGEYPEIRAEALVEGDLAPSIDFRSTYSTLLEDFFNIDGEPIVNGQFEKLPIISK